MTKKTRQIPQNGSDATTGRITALIASFMDGATTPAEEQEIYRFFASAPQAAPELEPYRQMFGWYASLAPKPRRIVWYRHKAVAAISGIAASIALLAAIATFTLSGPETPDTLYASYTGSYIVRNGQRITDLRTIYPELIRAEKLVDSIAAATAPVEIRHDENLETVMLEDALAHIDDPQLAMLLRRELME